MQKKYKNVKQNIPFLFSEPSLVTQSKTSVQLIDLRQLLPEEEGEAIATCMIPSK